ncbi:MAG: glycosyltransferase [Phycisphaeraceae bacterium]
MECPVEKSRRGELLIVPHLQAHRAASGNLVLTRKFLEGTAAYAAQWPGRVTVAVTVEAKPDTNLDHQEIAPGDWPFHVIKQPSPRQELFRRMQQAAMVLISENLVVCKIAPAVRYAVVTEYSLKTRLRIAMETTRNPLRRLKRHFRERWTEHRARRGLAAAAGVQCNGFPTYESYRTLNPNSLLFFDSRVRSRELVDGEALDRRLARLQANQPLRLLFSGRLIGIKGVDHLPKIAHELRRRNVPFHMSICGAGEGQASLAQKVRDLGLADRVTLRGVLDFTRELLPLARDATDLFICPHVQGDPSCTYLETMACGVPIVGYANEAWQPLAKLSRAGWQTPMDDPAALADRVAQLHHQRSDIATASLAARRFAGQHTFEKTFSRRVDHLLTLAR